MKLLFSVLAVSDKWFFDVFQAIRNTQMSAINSDYVEVMIILASIIIAFKLIKLSYTIMSDEQNGGFGGISMWEVLRPIVVLVLLINCSSIISFFDEVCNNISTSLVNSTGYSRIKNDMAAIMDKYEKYESAENDINTQKGLRMEANKLTGKTVKNSYEALEDIYKQAGITLPNDKNHKAEVDYENTTTDDDGNEIATIKHTHSPFFTTAKEKLNEIKDKDAKAIAERAINNLEKYEMGKTGLLNHEFAVLIAANSGCSKKAQKTTTIMAQVVFWLFDMLFVVMMAFAEIFLMIMAMILPVTLTLSLFDKWKDSLSSWAGKYIEISLWKVVGALICVCVAKAKASMIVYVGSFTKNTIEKYSNLQASFSTDELISSESILIITFCIGLAGLISLISIPSITTTALSLTGGAVSGAETGGGTAKGLLFAPAKAAAGGVKGANALKGLKK